MLKVFLALLPILLAIMGRLQGLHSQSLVDFSVINKYYIFQAREHARTLPPCPAALVLRPRTHCLLHSAFAGSGPEHSFKPTRPQLRPLPVPRSSDAVAQRVASSRPQSE